ncbi:PAS domain S-box protein [Ensifer sp. ENS07]|uniref:PAS domain-containing sensor histidine kinase n=1 Tax=Ensifer sp. ENS07 TaxID=2769274 RepID=UPI00177FC2A8|nr:PAS domain-containing sensor histidine kinase [Ensifer sp. ENS07]MBD9639001.1 PAS domain S-box protein [Ensifer sp. ENS07]
MKLESITTTAASNEMARLIEAYDWEDSPLGAVKDWPPCLQAAVDIMLPAQAQIVLFWGEEFIALYNDAYAPTIGDKHPRALGRPAREHWGELWSDLEPLLRRVLDGGETVVAKDRPFYIERHGYPETVYFDISYSPVRDENKTARGVFCIVNETTERVRFENALQASEAQLRAIFSQSAAGIAQTDLKGRFLLVNSRFCDIVGYSEAELQTMRIHDITFAEDMAESARLFNEMTRNGDSYEMEKRYVRKDGGLVWVTNSVSVLRDKQGVFQRAAAVIVDITERKRAQEVERRLAAIIASSNDAILGIDLKMRITNWNGGAERLYGYSAQEIVGRSVMTLVPEDRIDEEPAILRRVSAGLKVEPYETKRLHKDGRTVDVLLSVSPIYDAYGSIVGASKLAHDITARKETERLQTVLVGELNHRVKNLFATVLAIARQTLGVSATDPSELQGFEARIASMARAHDLLMRGTWEKAELRAVIDQSLAPFPPERFEISGPRVHLPPRAVISVSLALHELATNAAKYGALSASEGRASITWSLDADGRLTLRWAEAGGPTVKEPSRKGFGSRLIKTLLAAELNGQVNIAYRPEGVVCEVAANLQSGWNQADPADDEV